MSTAVDVGIDFDLIADEFAQACESPHHGRVDSSHDDGPATHYMLIGHECYGPVGGILAVCHAYMKHWTTIPRFSSCFWCGRSLDPTEQNRILGPIGG